MTLTEIQLKICRFHGSLSQKGSRLQVFTKGREGKAKIFAKTFPPFRFSTKCREIRKARRRSSLRLGLALNVGKGKARRKFSLRLGSALNVGK